MKKKAVVTDLQEDITEQLSKDHACYILITCDKPSSDGNMNVNMSYEGDNFLVSYLIQGAQNLIDEKILEEA